MRRQVLFVSALVVSTVASKLVSCINWNPYTPKYYHGSAAVTASFAYIDVPIDHAHPAPAKTLQLYCRRFSKGVNPTKHLFLLSGGPGGKSHSFEADLDETIEHFELSDPNLEFAIYITDHRGVGKSTKLCKSGDLDWMSKIGSFKYPPSAISVTNAAHDLIAVAALLRNDGAQGLMLAFGVSYGTLPIVRAVTISPTTFDAVLLDGLDDGEAMPPIGAIAGDEILANCQSNPYCSSQIGNTLSSLSKGLPSLHTPNKNACTRFFYDLFTPQFAHRRGYSRPCSILNIVLRTLALSRSAYKTARFHPAMLLVPLIFHLHECPDPKLFERFLASVEEHFLRFRPSTPSAATRGAGGGYSSRSNDLVNSAISVNEYYDFSRGNSFCSALKGCHSTIADPCPLFRKFHRLNKAVGSLFHSRDEYHLKPPSTKHTRIYVVHGELDYVTTFQQAQGWYARFSALFKHFYRLRNIGHSVMTYSNCSSVIFREFLVLGDGSVGDRCLVQENMAPLDWELSSVSIIQPHNVWINPPTVVQIAESIKATNSVPTQFVDYSGISKKRWILWLLCIIVGIIIVAALVLFCIRRRRTRFTSPRTENQNLHRTSKTSQSILSKTSLEPSQSYASTTSNSTISPPSLNIKTPILENLARERAVLPTPPPLVSPIPMRETIIPPNFWPPSPNDDEF